MPASPMARGVGILADDARRQTLVLAVLALGVVVTLYGIWSSGLLAQRPWSTRGFGVWPIVVVVSVAIGALLATRSIYWRQWIAALTAGYALIAVGLAAVAALVVLALAAWCLGCVVVERLLHVEAAAWKPGTALGIAVRLSAGAACLIAAVQFAAHWPVNTPAVYAAAMMGIVVAGRRSLAPLWSTMWTAAPRASRVESAVVGLLTLSVALHVIVAAKPEIGHDALTMHLLIPAHLAEHARWHFDVTRGVFSVMPLAADWYFSLGYMLGGEFGARLANVALVLLGALWLWALLEGWVDTTWRRLVVALHLSTPFLGLTSGTLFAEHLWAVMLLAAAGVALSEGPGFRARWTLAASFVAVALATKILAVFVVPVYAALAILQRWSRGAEPRPRRWAAWLAAGCVILAIAAWPYGVAFVATGNPVFPFMNHVFKSPHYPADTPFDNSLYNHGLRFSTLWDVTFHTDRHLEALPGGAGFQWLVFLPAAVVAAVALRQRRVAPYWALAGALIVGIFSQQSYLRYAEPAAAFLTVALAVLFSPKLVGDRAVKVTAATAAVVVLANAYFFASSGWYQRNLVERDFGQYVTNYVPERDLVTLLNALDPAARTLFIGRYFAAGLTGRSVSDVWYFPALALQFAAVQGERDFAGVMRGHDVAYVVGLNDTLRRYGIQPGSALALFDVVASRGSATLLRLKPQARYTEERLRNPELKPGLDGWHLAGGVGLPGGGARVTVRNTLTQAVVVWPGERYRVSVKVRCPEPGIVRLQVNWATAAGAFAGAFLQAKDCLGDAEFGEIAQVPATATAGVYYVAGHDERPVEVMSASFKR